ncbi:probable BOI-related E3 ubiquitin-protein ligase 3 isoform X1 [Primulina eburnea]|uniref:probable BOI-related E3 ubiquitin-protein ligase 3 isoform X1 n=2 Tax=Primulina eburnea TaxID=1245227 RepID=UPI003C6C0951
MAVEAPQISRKRETMMNGVEGSGNVYACDMLYGLIAPGTTTTAGAVFPVYGLPINDKTAAMKCDSGLTYAVPVSRKRSRDANVTPLHPSLCSGLNQIGDNGCGSFTFLGEDLTFQIQQQQLEVDRFVSQHTENARMEIEERRKRYSYSRHITAAVEDNIMKKMKAKDEEIQRIGKLNCVLEERVKVLSIENQIWRDLAQSNEATANALRSNLEQVIAQRRRDDEAASIDDAQSCCGETCEEIEQRTLRKRTSTGGRYMICRSCGEEESCVLLLPCRHLCLCTVCGSSLHICPLCKSPKTASVHVNMS